MRAATPTRLADALYWVRGFGGVKVPGKGSVWPCRLCPDGAGGEKVQRQRKPGRVLVMSFGDDAYIWAKSSAMSAFVAAEAEAALRLPRSTLAPMLKSALDDAIAASSGARVSSSPSSSSSSSSSSSASKKRSGPPTPRTDSQSPSKKRARTATPIEPPAFGRGRARAIAEEEAEAEAEAEVEEAEVEEADEESEDDSGTDDNPEGLSAYELERLANIARNERILESLGVATAAASLCTGASRAPKVSLTPEQKARRAQERAERLAEAQANKRTSSRLAEGGSSTAKPVRYAEEYAALDDAEQVRVPLRIKRKAKGGGFGRGRGGRAAEGAESGLSEEERAAVAAAYAEAEGWLSHMRRYFTDKLSEANLRNVMKQATALATGEGIPHTRYNRWFRKGEPVTLDEDLVQLRADANRFLLPEDDPGHGWRLDHPIGKMAIFQAHLAERQKLSQKRQKA